MDTETYRAAQLALFESLASGRAQSTTVPLRADYVGVATCLTLVHLLPDELAARIHGLVLGRLSAFRAEHYWYPAQDLHLTLKNVQKAQVSRTYGGEVVERACAAIGRVCKVTPPLHFEILGPICLPTSIVLRAIGTLSHREAALSFDRELSRCGVLDDKVYASNDVFVGNITVCRFTKRSSVELLEAVAALRDHAVANHTVRTASLVTCDEVCSSRSRVVLKEFALEA